MGIFGTKAGRGPRPQGQGKPAELLPKSGGPWRLWTAPASGLPPRDGARWHLADDVLSFVTEIRLTSPLHPVMLNESPYIQVGAEVMGVLEAWSDGRCVVVRGIRSDASRHIAGSRVEWIAPDDPGPVGTVRE